jgi:hypothetical protein
MIEGPKQGFGRRGAAPPTPAARTSPHVVYREMPRAAFHDSHAERHWPKYGGAGAAILMLGFFIFVGRSDFVGLFLGPVLFGLATYMSLSKLRKTANDLHRLRTETSRSPAFLAGAFAGLLYFLYSTFVSPEMVLGIEWGPTPDLGDGVQRQDLAAAALQVLKAIGLMACGGWLFQFVAKRLRPANESES